MLIAGGPGAPFLGRHAFFRGVVFGQSIGSPSIRAALRL
jgi:hypothetical protein